MDNRFSLDFYRLRRKFFKFLGEDFHIYNERGEVVFYSKMKALKLKEDLRVYESESMNEELLVITTEDILDFGATYAVDDPREDERVGFLKRRAMKSMIRDEWVFLGPDENEIATLREDSRLLALIRRFIINLIPQTYHVTVNNRTVATYEQNWNPFIYQLEMDFSEDPDGTELDRRLGIAAAVLLGGIEGHQD
jgi:uncharacterized protein YxjI